MKATQRQCHPEGGTTEGSGSFANAQDDSMTEQSFVYRDADNAWKF